MSKKLKIFDCQGVETGEYSLPEECLELQKGEQAVHETVVAFLAEQRAGTACTKTRGKVRGGGAKPFRQKGLGRARAGSIRSPLWTGGGTIFGPQPRDFSKKVNKKVRKLALKRAFSERVEEKAITLLESLELADGKTKSTKIMLANLKISGNVLLVVDDYDEKTICATGNLPDLVLRKASTVNVYELLRFDNLVYTRKALELFLQRLA